MQVLCTNPAALGGGSGAVEPDLRRASRSFQGSALAAGITVLGLDLSEAVHGVARPNPGAYQATCSSAEQRPRPADIAPARRDRRRHPSPDPTWGLHLLDANIALGNLISIVHTEAAAFAARH